MSKAELLTDKDKMSIGKLAAWSTAVITIAGLALWWVPGYIDARAGTAAEARLDVLIEKLQPKKEFTQMQTDMTHMQTDIAAVKVTGLDTNEIFRNYLMCQANPAAC
jgi:hypothetical protein